MRIAPGGLIYQTIARYTYSPNTWDLDRTTVFNVQILNAALFQKVTGALPPPSPISASTYAKLGLPFFELQEEKVHCAGVYVINSL